MAAPRSYAILLGLLVVTGSVLMFYYTPVVNVAGAPGGPPKITFGMVVRGAHFWTSAAILVSALWVLGAAFFRQRTSAPIRVGRLQATAVFVMTALLAITGLLLPWDQLAHFVTGEIARCTGFSPTLIEIYTLHVIGLPVILAAVLIAYFRGVLKGRQTAST